MYLFVDLWGSIFIVLCANIEFNSRLVYFVSIFLFPIIVYERRPEKRRADNFICLFEIILCTYISNVVLCVCIFGNASLQCTYVGTLRRMNSGWIQFELE